MVSVKGIINGKVLTVAVDDKIVRGVKVFNVASVIHNAVMIHLEINLYDDVISTISQIEDSIQTILGDVGVVVVNYSDNSIDVTITSGEVMNVDTDVSNVA